jgi:hypothetical protein
VSIQAFTDAIARFNYAGQPVGNRVGIISPGDYIAVQRFLANPTSIHRVNHGQPDPGPLTGTPVEVVAKLRDQIGKWPTLEYDPNSLTLVPPNPPNGVAHLVRGTGRYTDNQNGVLPHPVFVAFEYHFDRNDQIELVIIAGFGVRAPGTLVLGPIPNPF